MCPLSRELTTSIVPAVGKTEIRSYDLCVIRKPENTGLPDSVTPYCNVSPVSRARYFHSLKVFQAVRFRRKLRMVT